MEYAIAAAVLISFSLGAFAGHASGYARRGYVEHVRRLRAIDGGPRYARTDVGAAE